ncbi:hypothetical protein VKT23_001765 [Stygiomarasmius scandens]|uniref:Uncharacterized protein n=1 Tax=Marasmiellus scandens TaxID=2682957 RepID=A0ABR1JZX8_9AGAR
MPQNCSADVEAVISHIDSVFTSNDTAAINKIKNLFGLAALSHLDDVAGVRNNLWDWQSLQPTSGPNAQFFQFCDTLEVLPYNGAVAPAEGFGLDHALNAWGNYWTSTYLENLCGGSSIEDCLGTYDPNADFYTDTSLDNAGRSWFWIVCNEVGYLQDGPPEDVPALVSRLTQPESDIRQCELMFSDVFSSSNPPKMAEGVANTNEQYLGWNVSIEHLFFANGHSDPWREATVSANGVDVQSTPSQKVQIGDGFHCSDLSIASGQVDSTVKAVQDAWFATVPSWLAEWAPGKAKISRREQVTKRAVSSKKAANLFFREPEVIA